MWELPEFARFLDRLATTGRLLLFGKRGTGLSDRIARIPALERRADDIAAVMDAAGSSRAAIAALGEGAAIAAMFAADSRPSAPPARPASLAKYSGSAIPGYRPPTPERPVSCAYRSAGIG